MIPSRSIHTPRSMISPRFRRANARIITFPIGADIAEQPELTDWTEKDTITNYHMAQILMLRRELLQMLPLRTEGKA